MFARYELYIAHHFVSHHKPASRRSTPIITNSPDSDSPSFTSTPSDYSTDLLSDGAGTAAAAEREPMPDGASLYCISVNVIVFKHGGICTSRARALGGGVGAMQFPCARTRTRGGAWAREMRELYRRLWRAMSKGPERWWDTAMYRLWTVASGGLRR
ncbi:hypothetical protein EI94DRAFT_368296 [Lactarius quietus]|nr:hypothetical protein EI94DRAFT_368296 [Lactarius quietus]